MVSYDKVVERLSRWVVNLLCFVCMGLNFIFIVCYFCEFISLDWSINDLFVFLLNFMGVLLLILLGVKLLNGGSWVIVCVVSFWAYVCFGGFGL